MAEPKAYISKIQLDVSGDEYYLKDIEARDLITALSSATIFMGISSTIITDKGAEKPTLDGEESDPQKGWIVIYNDAEFVYDGNKWLEFGDLSGLGDLAKHNVKDIKINVYAPTDSVLGADTTFTASAPIISVSGTTKDNVLGENTDISLQGSAVKKTLKAVSSDVTLNTSSKNEVNTGYTTTTKKLVTESVNVLSDITAIKSCTSVGELPTFTVSNEVLTLTTGTLPSTTDIIPVTKTIATGSVSDSDSNGSDIVTNITSSGTINALTNVTVSEQPIITLTAGEDDPAEVVTDVDDLHINVSREVVSAVTNIGTITAGIPTVTVNKNDNVNAVTTVTAETSYSG